MAKVEVMTAIKILSQKMEDLQLCSDLITKHGNALQKSLSELESLDSASDMTSKIKAINEKATLYRIASSRMINVRTISDPLYATRRLILPPTRFAITRFAIYCRRLA